jgi:methylmalonyl-CoA mutase C-terminal domain/subunit
VFGGGIIPDEDIPILEAQGLAAIFTPGTPLSEIVGWVNEHIPES